MIYKCVLRGTQKILKSSLGHEKLQFYVIPSQLTWKKGSVQNNNNVPTAQIKGPEELGHMERQSAVLQGTHALRIDLSVTTEIREIDNTNPVVFLTFQVCRKLQWRKIIVLHFFPSYVLWLLWLTPVTHNFLAAVVTLHSGIPQGIIHLRGCSHTLSCATH